MKVGFSLAVVVFSLLVSGCVFPGDAIVRPVKLQSHVPDADAHTASVVQIAHHASRSELVTFASRGQLPDIPANRAVITPITEQQFTAEFGSFMMPARVWILPPLGFQPATDILIRLDSASPRTYVLRDKRLYRVSVSTGVLTKCISGTVKSLEPEARDIKAPEAIQVQLLP